MSSRYPPGLTKHLNHEPILKLPTLVPRPRTQHAALIGNLLADDRRAAEENSNLDLIIFAAIFLVQTICQYLAHIVVVCFHNAPNVRTSEMSRVDKTSDGRLRMVIRSMLFEQPTEYVLGDLLALLSHIGVDADVEIFAVWFLTEDFVEKIGKPQEVVLVANHPM